MSEPQISAVDSVAAMFDQVAPTYEQAGVEFFRPIARGLLEELGPQPGERALDLGCGRGALTLALAESVCPEGTVVALDLSSGMLAGLRSEVAHAGLTNVEVVQGDAQSPGWTSEFDVVAASLVLFFLPDPTAAFAAWVRCAKPGGRVGISTFAESSAAERAIDDLFNPYLPAGVLDARTTGQRGIFASSQALEQLFVDSGVGDVRTEHRAITTRFADIGHWREWTMSTGRRGLWRHVPAAEHDKLLEAAAQILRTDSAKDGLTATHHLRYTVGRRLP